jgi:hypothetical protein
MLATHEDLDDQVDLSFLKPTWTQTIPIENSNPYEIYKQSVKI